MKRSELEHVIRAAKEITGETEFVIIGSQALHGAFPNLVDKLVTSHECDIYVPNAPEKTELLNSIGMLTPFAQSYGYYADRSIPTPLSCQKAGHPISMFAGPDILFGNRFEDAAVSI